MSAHVHPVVAPDDATHPSLLAGPFLGALAQRLDLTERLRHGERWRPLTSEIDGSDAGVIRLFDDPRLELVVGVVLTVPMVPSELHTVLLLTAPDDPRPHFTFEAVRTAGELFLSVDLVPKLDLVSNRAYTDAVYEPLSDVHWDACAADGITLAVIHARHRMVLSPWLLAARVDAAGIDAANRLVASYLDHWATLIVEGLPDGADPVDTSGMVARDHDMRRRLYSHDATPNWGRFDRVAGSDTGDWLRDLLVRPDLRA